MIFCPYRLKQLRKPSCGSEAKHSRVDTKVHGSRITVISFLAAGSAAVATLVSLGVVGGARLLATDEALGLQSIEETTELGNIGGGRDGNRARNIVQLGDLDAANVRLVRDSGHSMDSCWTYVSKLPPKRTLPICLSSGNLLILVSAPFF